MPFYICTKLHLILQYIKADDKHVYVFHPTSLSLDDAVSSCLNNVIQLTYLNPLIRLENCITRMVALQEVIPPEPIFPVQFYGMY